MKMIQEVGLGDQLETKFGSAIVRQILSKTIKIELLSGVMKGQFIFLDYEKHAKDIHITQKSQQPKSKAPEHPIPPTDKDLPILSYKSCIDSLRFGLVPTDYIRTLTLGFGGIKKWTQSTLPHENQDRPSVNQIIGPFGEGKSHTLSIIRYLALQEGYLVGRVEVDGKEISLAKPDKFLYHLFSTIEGKDIQSAMPIIEIYRKALKKGYRGPFVAKSGEIDRIHEMYNLIGLLERYEFLDDLGYLIEEVLTCSEDMTVSDVKEKLIDETKGRIDQSDIRLYPIIGRTLKDRPREFVEALVATALVAKLAGYKGLIITVDECEVEEALLTPKERKFRETIFDALSSYFSGNSKYVTSPLGLYFASVPSISYELDDSMRIDSIVSGSNGKTSTIEPFYGWNSEDTEQLAMVKSIHDIYRRSYGCDGVDERVIIQKLDESLKGADIYDSGGIRYFMKRYISLLDTIYGPPNGMITERS